MVGRAAGRRDTGPIADADLWHRHRCRLGLARHFLQAIEIDLNGVEKFKSGIRLVTDATNMIRPGQAGKGVLRRETRLGQRPVDQACQRV